MARALMSSSVCPMAAMLPLPSMPRTMSWTTWRLVPPLPLRTSSTFRGCVNWRNASTNFAGKDVFPTLPAEGPMVLRTLVGS